MMNIVESTEAHVIEMCNTGIREADNRECLRMSGGDAQCALYEAFRVSKDRRVTVLRNGKAIAMFGLKPSLLGEQAIPWFLAVEGIEKYWYSIAKYSRKFLRIMLAEYASLANYVDAENVESIKWLKWLGFKVESSPTYVRGYPFFKFYIEREDT